MTNRRAKRMYAVIVVIAISMQFSGTAIAQSAYRQCLTEAIHAAEDSVTVGQLRANCSSEFSGSDVENVEKISPVYETSALDERQAALERAEGRPFVLTPHKPNYFMITQMAQPNQEPFIPSTGLSEPLSETEFKFQFSIKAPIWRDMFGSDIDLYTAFSTTAWWQALNDDLSAPFRETNYEPEVFLRSVTDYGFLGMKIAGWQLGLNHESNGRTEPRSRSWNRIMGRVNLEIGRELAVQLRAWYRIPESADIDNNPLIYRYLGYGDVRAVWTPSRSTWTAMVRPAPEKTSFEVTWSYPVSQVFRVYAQYYNGYGENLLDYDFDMERWGIGFAFNDFLARR